MIAKKLAEDGEYLKKEKYEELYGKIPDIFDEVYCKIHKDLGE